MNLEVLTVCGFKLSIIPVKRGVESRLTTALMRIRACRSGLQSMRTLSRDHDSAVLTFQIGFRKVYIKGVLLNVFTRSFNRNYAFCEL